ncbi:MAG: TPM domain-containing protein [Candidatus Limimorpha sp.]
MRKIFLSLFFLLSITAFSQNIPSRPNPPRLVNDFANIISDRQEQALERKLVIYNDTTSTQICVVTVSDLGIYPIAQFAYEIGEKWGVGNKENNGAIILVKPKNDNGKGQVSIQVGYGLEPYVTDAMSKRIIEQNMIPAFKANDYYTGINDAVDMIISLASGQFSAEEEESDTLGIIIVIISLGFILLVIALLGSKGNNGGGTMSSRDGDDIMKALFWASIFSNNRGRNNWGGFSGGSGGFGGGGFGGFGGGHFGGGGASGSW